MNLGPSAARAARTAATLFELATCCLLLAFYGYFLQVPGPNELSRYDLTLALVRDHTTSIDPYQVNTIDKAKVGGRYYTEKAIGASLVAAPAVWALERFQHLGAYGDYVALYPVHVATRLAVTLPAALAAWGLYRTIRRVQASASDALLLAASLALGSAYGVFATVLFGHAAAAAFAALAAAVVFFRRASQPEWLLAGALAGLAVLTEYPAALAAAALGLLALARSRAWLADALAKVRSSSTRLADALRLLPRAPALAYAAGAALALSPLPVYAFVSFGSPFAIGYGYVDDPAFAGARQGLFGIGLPSAAALREILFGPAGLLTQSPYLALAVPGFVLWLRRREYRAEGLVAIAVAAGFLLVNAGYYLPLGGQSMGPRFLVPALPFLVLAIAFVPRWLRWLGSPLVAYSAVAMVAITAVYPKAGPGQPDALRSYWWPRLLAGDVAPNWGEVRFGLEDLESLLPLLGLALLAALGLAHALAFLPRKRARRESRGDQRRWPIVRWATAYALVAFAAATYVAAPIDFQDPVRPPDAFAQQALDEPAPDQLRVRFGEELEVLGYSLEEDSVEPGDAVHLELYWRKLRRIASRYAVYVHLVGRGGEKVGGFDAVPGAGSYPAEMWPVGAVVRDAYSVRVAASAAEPTALRVRVGVYESGVMRQLPAFDPRGASLGDGPALIRLRLGRPVSPDDGQPTLRASLGGVIGLTDWQVSARQPRAGETVSGSLRWRALQRPPRDYTAFVQALGPDGLVGQWDSQPLGGDYPTSLWLPGEEVVDGFSLRIKPDAPPGTYSLIAGLYDLATLARLPAGEADFVRLGEIQVVR